MTNVTYLNKSEEDVLEEMLAQIRQLQVLGEAAEAPPMVGHCAAAMRDDDLQGREILEHLGGQELHEGRGVAIEIMGAGGRPKDRG